MRILKIKKFAGILLLAISLTWQIVYSQNITDISQKNVDKDLIRRSKIKSESIWEYHYAGGNEEVFSDSGYKSFNYTFDNDGRITQYTKYHIFSDLTIKETYQYGKNDNISQTARYNSGDEMIETIDYKYNKQGILKKEIHTAYHNGIRPGVYFSILASVDDDSLFGTLQDELEIEPRLQAYSITVNISDPDEQNQYIVVGDESDPTSPRYSWSQLSIESQRGLLSYKGPKRKEHTYISKNIANVEYKFDKNHNLVERAVYNTSNDLIEQESYRYDENNHRTGFSKYNENGKVSSIEVYTYDAKGRLVENTGMDPDGKVISKSQYKYDDADNLIEKTWLNAAGEVNGKYKYVYDNNYKISEEIKYRGDNEQESRQVYKYDSNGNILEIIKYDINDKKEKLIRYVYELY